MASFSPHFWIATAGFDRCAYYCPHYCPLPHLPRLSHSPSPKTPSSLRVANALRPDLALPTSSLPPFIRHCFYPAPPRLIRPYAPSDKSKSNQKVPNPISKSLRNLSVRSRQIRFPAFSFPPLRPPQPRSRSAVSYRGRLSVFAVIASSMY